MIREAMLYQKESGGGVECALCAHRCRIGSSRRGICGVRENLNGVLRTLVYGILVAENADPIEKKPLFHFEPGSRSYSVATAGCNFRCLFCQNAAISQMPSEEGRIAGCDAEPDMVVQKALHAGCRSISYTYTEPTVYFEFAYDTAVAARKAGLKNVFVTNGFMTEEALRTVAPFLDAANVDLKSFRDDFYRRQCGARLQPVLDSLKRMKELGIWVEVTTLLIPGLNDEEGELADIAGFIASLGRETPWHVSRFHPRYRMRDRLPTPVSSISRAVEIGRERGLRYVYSGNVPGDRGEKTFCASCGFLLIDRFGFSVRSLHLEGGRCPRCREKLEGVF